MSTNETDMTTGSVPSDLFKALTDATDRVKSDIAPGIRETLIEVRTKLAGFHTRPTSGQNPSTFVQAVGLLADYALHKRLHKRATSRRMTDAEHTAYHTVAEWYDAQKARHDTLLEEMRSPFASADDATMILAEALIDSMSSDVDHESDGRVEVQLPTYIYEAAAEYMTRGTYESVSAVEVPTGRPERLSETMPSAITVAESTKRWSDPEGLHLLDHIGESLGKEYDQMQAAMGHASRSLKAIEACLKPVQTVLEGTAGGSP